MIEGSRNEWLKAGRTVGSVNEWISEGRKNEWLKVGRNGGSVNERISEGRMNGLVDEDRRDEWRKEEGKEWGLCEWMNKVEMEWSCGWKEGRKVGFIANAYNANNANALESTFIVK